MSSDYLQINVVSIKAPVRLLQRFEPTARVIVIIQGLMRTMPYYIENAHDSELIVSGCNLQLPERHIASTTDCSRIIYAANTLDYRAHFASSSSWRAR